MVETVSDTVVGDEREITVRVTPQRADVRLLAVELSVEGGTVVRRAGRRPAGGGAGAGRGPPLGDLPRATGNGLQASFTVAGGGPVSLRAIDGGEGLDGLPGWEPRPDGVDAAGTHSSDLVVVAATTELG